MAGSFHKINRNRKKILSYVSTAPFLSSGVTSDATFTNWVAWHVPIPNVNPRQFKDQNGNDEPFERVNYTHSNPGSGNTGTAVSGLDDKSKSTSVTPAAYFDLKKSLRGPATITMDVGVYSSMPTNADNEWLFVMVSRDNTNWHAAYIIGSVADQGHYKDTNDLEISNQTYRMYSGANIKINPHDYGWSIDETYKVRVAQLRSAGTGNWVVDNLKVENSYFVGTQPLSCSYEVYDNFFVQHQIPRSEAQYSWISSSLDQRRSVRGFQTSSSDLVFFDTSQTTSHDKIELINSSSPNYSTNTSSLVQSFKSTGSMYGYSSWKQIRVGQDHNVARRLREDNKIVIQDIPQATPGTNNPLNNPNSLSYEEPAVSDINKSTKLVGYIEGTDRKQKFKITHQNSLDYFANKSLSNKLGLSPDNNTTYAKLKKNFENNNTIIEANNITLEQKIFPNPGQVTSKESRKRVNYTETDSTMEGGYNQVYGYQNTFWRPNITRTAGSKNSQAISGNMNYAVPLVLSTSLLTEPSNTWVSAHPEVYSFRYDGDGVQYYYDLDYDVWSTQPYRKWSNRTYWIEFEKEYSPAATASVTFDIRAFQTGSTESWGGAGGAWSQYTHRILLQYKCSTGSQWQTVGPDNSAFSVHGISIPQAKAALGVALTEIEESYVTFVASFGAGERMPADSTFQLRLAESADYAEGSFEGKPFRFKNLAISGSTRTVRSYDSLSAWPLSTPAASGAFYLNSNHNSQSIGELSKDTDASVLETHAMPNLCFFESTNNYIAETSTDYMEYLTPSVSGKTPWYNSISEYEEDVRSASKTSGILPEFNISEHMSYFVDENRGNFRKLNNKYLSIKGGFVSSSAANRTDITIDTTFSKKFTNAKSFEDFSSFKKSHSNYAKPSKMSIKVDALKKLLPYNGFFPVLRSVQIGNLLSSSIAGNLDAFNETVPDSREKGLMAALKPLMSPGIFYNTIKAGYAVDYPLYTSSVNASTDTDTYLADPKLETTPNFRMPFETLVDLKGGFPEDKEIRFVANYGGNTSPSYPYNAKWNGKKKPLFELANHNYLAESTNFFLRDGKLNKFTSKTQAEFDDFEVGKTYYMDVTIDDNLLNNQYPYYSFKTLQTDIGVDSWYLKPSPRDIEGPKAASLEDVPHSGSTISLTWHDQVFSASSGYVRFRADLKAGNHPEESDIVSYLHGYSALKANYDLGSSNWELVNYHTPVSSSYYLLGNDKNSTTTRLKGSTLTGFRGSDIAQSRFSILQEFHNKDIFYIFSCFPQSDDLQLGSNGSFANHPTGTIAVLDQYNAETNEFKNIIYSVFETGSTPANRNKFEGARIGVSSSTNLHFLAANEDNHNVLFLSVDMKEKKPKFTNNGWQYPDTHIVGSNVRNYGRGGAVMEYDNSQDKINLLLSYEDNSSKKYLEYYEISDINVGSNTVTCSFSTEIPHSQPRSMASAMLPNTASGKNDFFVFFNQQSNSGSIYMFQSSSHGGPSSGDNFAEPLHQNIIPGPSGYNKFYTIPVLECAHKGKTSAFSRATNVGNAGFSHGRGNTEGAGQWTFNTYDPHSGDFSIYSKGLKNNSSYTTSNLGQQGIVIIRDTDQEKNFLITSLNGDLQQSSVNTDNSASIAVFDITNPQYPTASTILNISSSDDITNWAHNIPSGSTTCFRGYAHPNGFYDSVTKKYIVNFSGFSTSVSYYDNSVGRRVNDMEAFDSDRFIFTASFNSNVAGSSNNTLAAGPYFTMTRQTFAECKKRQNGKLFGLGIQDTLDPHYASYTPPSMYGKAIARLSFTPTASGKPSLEDIFNHIKIEELYADEIDKVAVINGRPYTSKKVLSRMPLSSSINLFGKFFEPKVSFDIDQATDSANASSTSIDNSQQQARWSLSTKYECPILDYSSSASTYASKYTTNLLPTDYSFIDSNYASASQKAFITPHATWYNHGLLPQAEDKGIFFSIKESFEGESETTGSLIDKCGFNAGTKRLGNIAQERQISEAIVVIPYLDRYEKGLTTNLIDGKYFIEVSKNEILSQKKTLTDTSNKVAVSGLDDESNISETSISKTLVNMEKFILPPHLDYIKYQDISPFVMYIIDISHNLEQQELADIWQGLMCKSMQEISKEENEITHEFTKHDFFYQKELPDDMKFFVFKIKQKAKQNYYDIVKETSSDKRFRFDFSGDNEKEIVPEYNYNWPYDYCSLVENASVSVELELKRVEEEE
tara:strand:+ start:57340 stop:63942 length:6603 start_codon:yes stop_codon:yes gene_type:complete